ncbi:MAG TPA: OB-fold domain-containing protein [Lentzea sp.]
MSTPDTREWFDRIDAGELTVPRCTACESFFLYPRSCCPRCGARSVELVPAAGDGVLLSFVINHRAPAGFEAPYALGVVRLAEGPNLTASIRTDRPESLEVDAAVRVAFEERGERRVVCFEVAG